jgi:hypothetical protein
MTTLTVEVIGDGSGRRPHRQPRPVEVMPQLGRPRQRGRTRAVGKLPTHASSTKTAVATRRRVYVLIGREHWRDRTSEEPVGYRWRDLLGS